MFGDDLVSMVSNRAGLPYEEVLSILAALVEIVDASPDAMARVPADVPDPADPLHAARLVLTLEVEVDAEREALDGAIEADRWEATERLSHAHLRRDARMLVGAQRALDQIGGADPLAGTELPELIDSLDPRIELLATT